jgi:cytochrome c biogenesis protein CcmG, thiol:disulfide interchange protein DsbE
MRMQRVNGFVGLTIVSALALSGACGLAVSTAHAQESADAAPANDGRALFQRAADVIKNAQAVSYSLKVTVTNKDGTGPATSMLGTLYQNTNASVIQRRVPASIMGGWICKYKGEMTDKDGKATPIDFAWKTATIELVNHKEQKVIEKTGKQINGPGYAMATNTRMAELFDAAPFAKELQAKEFVLEAEKTIAGEVCDVVLITSKDGKSQTRWAFAKSDGLPRMKQSMFDGFTEGIVSSEVSSLRMDVIKVDVPEGFKEERQSAVVRPTTPTPVIEPNPMSDPSATPADPVRPALDPQGTPVAPEPAPAPAGPKAAADFELTKYSGEKVKLSDQRGSVVVLQFFGSWCLPCRDWHAMLATAAKAGGEVKLFALSTRERDNANAVTEMSAPGNTGFTHLVNADDVAKTYGVSVYPTTLVIDGEGMIVLEIAGETSEETATKVTDAVREALTGGKRASK